MFALGNLWIGNYKLWITTPVFSLPITDSKADTLPYYEVLLLREEKIDKYHYSFYTHLINDESFRFLFFLNERKQPTDKTDVTAYNSYLERKDMQMPLWKLSKLQVSQLINVLLSMENKSC